MCSVRAGSHVFAAWYSLINAIKLIAATARIYWLMGAFDCQKWRFTRCFGHFCALRDHCAAVKAPFPLRDRWSQRRPATGPAACLQTVARAASKLAPPQNPPAMKLKAACTLNVTAVADLRRHHHAALGQRAMHRGSSVTATANFRAAGVSPWHTAAKHTTRGRRCTRPPSMNERRVVHD
jgi:hypothetical protein